jgi:hypothetical protein
MILTAIAALAMAAWMLSRDVHIHDFYLTTHKPGQGR